MLERAPVAIVGRATSEFLANKLLRRYGSCRGGFSCESENDLASMVSDFLEIGSSGADSWCSSDSDSSYSDLALLADKISVYKQSVDQFASDLSMVVNSLILSSSEKDQMGKSDACNSSCVFYMLVKLLQSSGYDAAVCESKWQVVGKVPGGEHEYIDVISHQKNGVTERYIIDVDFRSHFQIARAIKPYNAVLSSLPPVYVGTMSKLKQLLQIMADAARCSLEQSSMPLPPWRSLGYLEAKWESPCERIVDPHSGPPCSSHMQCIGLLRRLKSSVLFD